MPWRCLRCCEYSSSSQKYVRLSYACASHALTVSFCRTLTHCRLRRFEQIIAADYTRRTKNQMIYFDLSLFYTVTHSRSQFNMVFCLLIYLSIYFIINSLVCLQVHQSYYTQNHRSPKVCPHSPHTRSINAHRNKSRKCVFVLRFRNEFRCFSSLSKCAHQCLWLVRQKQRKQI